MSDRSNDRLCARMEMDVLDNNPLLSAATKLAPSPTMCHLERPQPTGLCKPSAPQPNHDRDFSVLAGIERLWQQVKIYTPVSVLERAHCPRHGPLWLQRSICVAKISSRAVSCGSLASFPTHSPRVRLSPDQRRNSRHPPTLKLPMRPSFSTKNGIRGTKRNIGRSFPRMSSAVPRRSKRRGAELHCAEGCS